MSGQGKQEVPVLGSFRHKISLMKRTYTETVCLRGQGNVS